MMPDLRFVIGAVIATVLSGVTLFGLAATMHISYQSKVGPLEASRLLAYTPDSRHRIFDIPARRPDNPFANMPADPNPVPLRQQASEPASPPVETASLPPPANDADTVDERAVIDPPLPLDNDEPAPAVESAPTTPSPEPAAAAADSPPIEPVPATPSPSPEPAAAAADSPPIEPMPATPSPSPEPAAAAADSPPTETMPAAPAPVAEKPAEPAATPDVQQVASIPTTTTVAAETRGDAPSITEMRESPNPKSKRARKAAAKPKAAKRPPMRQAVAPPFAPIGFPTAISNADRPALGFWPAE